MLQVDLTKTDREINRFITALCSDYGVVRSIKIHRHPKPFVLVEMSTHHETLTLAGQYGRSEFGGCVLVHLKHGIEDIRDRIRKSLTQSLI